MQWALEEEKEGERKRIKGRESPQLGKLTYNKQNLL